MFRKRTVLAAGLMAAALALTACGRSETGSAAESSAPAATISSGPATGNLTMWAQGAEAEKLPALLKEFEAANPGVKVEVTPIPWDAAHNKYQTAIAGGQTPDIAQMGTTWMGDFADAFDPAPAEFADAGFFPGSVKSSEVNGASVGVPWYVDTRVIFYRKDLAEQAGYTTPRPTTTSSRRWQRPCRRRPARSGASSSWPARRARSSTSCRSAGPPAPS